MSIKLLELERKPVEGEAIQESLCSMNNFIDLVVPYQLYHTYVSI